MLFQGGQLFYKMIVMVRSLRRRRTDILDVGESTLAVGEQTVGETTRRRNDRNSFERYVPNTYQLVSLRLFFR